MHLFQVYPSKNKIEIWVGFVYLEDFMNVLGSYLEFRNAN